MGSGLDNMLQGSQRKIYEICNQIRDMLVDKNRKYGDSAINPVRVFSKSDNIEQLKVRIDDKISRIMSDQMDDDEDTIKDLVGYLVLLLVAREK